MGVLEARGDLDLPQEAVGADRRGQLRPEHLERHVAAVLEIFGEVDRRHAPRAEFPLDAIPAGEGRIQAIDGIGHRESSRRERATTSGRTWRTIIRRNEGLPTAQV